jgi:hypothetical protein
VASLEEYGILAYFYKNGTIEEVTSFGTPSNTSRYNSWQITANFSSAPLNITNVTPESDFAAIGWTNPAGTRFLRIFYQTTSGDIRSLRITQDQPWYLDPTVIANVPCGVPISAGRQVNSAGQVSLLARSFP